MAAAMVDGIAVTFRVTAPLDNPDECAVSLTGDTRKLTVVGSAPELGEWALPAGVTLVQVQRDSREATWQSEPVSIRRDRIPFKYRYVANGHRHSPTTRPLIWDRLSRMSRPLPPGASALDVRDHLEATPDNSDSGWVTTAGVGAFQLRVGQPPGSREPLVALAPGVCLEPFGVSLHEARAGDPRVPQGKPFAALSTQDVGLPEAVKSTLGGEKTLDVHNVTFLMNGQSIEALAFRVDLTSKKDGHLLARAFISHATLAPLQGSISASLISPHMEQVGTFRAAFLVVTSLDLASNTLTDLQRSRWSAAAAAARGTLDIGHRGAGASVGRDGSVRSVRENTMLSFQKAAVSHSDFIEFDVHVTADGEVVVHHDFEVKLAVGAQLIPLGIPALSYAQLASADFTRAMVGAPTPAAALLEGQQRANQRLMKRSNSSAEDMVRSLLKPRLGRASLDGGAPAEGAWRIADRIATLREAFRNTPVWLGFNIELKYPSDAQLAAMPTRFYSRNFFCDAILKVVLGEAGTRKVIFSTFDPDCATLLSLKQPRFPVFFLTCAGAKKFTDPRMNSLEAAFVFAKISNLQGVVAESTLILGRLRGVVEEFHRHGMYLFTWGEANNLWENYTAQKALSVDGIILDDVARVARASGKRSSLFNKPLSSPASYEELAAAGAAPQPEQHLPASPRAGGGGGGLAVIREALA